MSGRSTGALIWTCFKPMLKLYTMLAIGYYFGRKNVFDVSTSRNVSYVQQRILLPCFIFTNIVTYLQYTDIKPIAVVCFNSVLYILVAAATWLCVLYANSGLHKFAGVDVLNIAGNWKYGSLFAMMFSTSATIIVSYLQSLAYDTEVFSSDQINRGIAFAFIGFTIFEFVIYNGAHIFIKWDFRNLEKDNDGTKVLHEGKEESESSIQESSNGKEKLSALQKLPDVFVVKPEDSENVPDSDDRQSITSSAPSTLSDNAIPQPFDKPQDPQGHNMLEKLNSRASQFSTTSQRLRAIELRKLPPQNISDVVHEFATENKENLNALSLIRSRTNEPSAAPAFEDNPTTLPIWHKRTASDIQSKFRRLLNLACNPFKNPYLSAVMVSFFVSMIPWLKNLFVATPSFEPRYTINPHYKDAPDDYPPLNVFMTYSSYLAQAQVPISLFLLGATFSRLTSRTSDTSKISLMDKVSGLISSIVSHRTQLRGIVFITVLKLCVLPIIGISIVTAFDLHNWLGVKGITKEEQNVVIFVMCLFWALPSYAAQVYLTAVHTSERKTVSHQNDRELDFDVKSIDGGDKFQQLKNIEMLQWSEYVVLGVSLPFVSVFVLKHVLHY
ncbi:hypothetical protein DASC09_062290 [Saccharomycopsis crataegensis]|uniref:Uncharacterized protein n=1 Tax=Saccharomycopsis crataegensis TaxID=43959 RepID=A0AAV5QVA2_9ASCO|nr:hypothetical protein DASC09_062290 [Saccharomycopsis crataegensis]